MNVGLVFIFRFKGFIIITEMTLSRAFSKSFELPTGAGLIGVTESLRKQDIFSDGKGFFISNGDIHKGLISLSFHSIPRTIFSGHILYLIKKRWKVLKRVKKGQFWSKFGFLKFR